LLAAAFVEEAYVRACAEIKLKAEDTYRWAYVLVCAMIFMDIFRFLHALNRKNICPRKPKNVNLCLDVS